MGRTAATFRHTDIVRAVKAALAAGLEIVRTEINPQTGAIVLVHHRDGSVASDAPFDTWRAKRDARPA